jgi:hypothetical protein
MTRSKPQIPSDRVEIVIGRIHTVWIRSGGLGRREEGQEGARRREVVDLIGITSNGINKNISPSPHGGSAPCANSVEWRWLLSISMANSPKRGRSIGAGPRDKASEKKAPGVSPGAVQFAMCLWGG